MRQMLVAIGVLLSLAGCTALGSSDGANDPATSASGAPEGSVPITVVEQFQGAPPATIVDPTVMEAFTLLLDDGRLAVVTYGSSSCPSEPVSYDPDSTDALSLWVEYVGDADVCSADIGPTTSVIEAPSGVEIGVVLLNGQRVPALS